VRPRLLRNARRGREAICFTGRDYQPESKAATSGKAAVLTWRMAESQQALARRAGVRPNAPATGRAVLSHNDSVAGERARLGRCGWRPRQPPLVVAKTANHLVTPRAPRPPGEGAG
jgi:hypothetical protein